MFTLILLLPAVALIEQLTGAGTTGVGVGVVVGGGLL